MREADVRAVEAARRTAMLQGDVATLDRLLSDALIYIHASGARDSKASWLDRLAAGTLRYETLEFANPGITLVNDTALVSAHMNATVLRAGQPGRIACQYLAVWVQQPTGWQLVSVARHAAASQALNPPAPQGRCCARVGAPGAASLRLI